MAEIDHRDLAHLAVVTGQRNAFVQDPGGAVGAGQGGQGDTPPGRGGQAPDAAQHAARAASEGDEANAALVQPVEVFVSGQLRIEDQLDGRTAGAFLPEVDEPQDLVGLLVFGDTGVGVAQDAGGGIAGQEDQDALLRTTAAGNIVFFQRFFLSVGGDGVEVEIERLAARQAGPMHLVEPGRHEPDHGSVIDARTVAGQVRAFGDHVEAGEQGDALVADQVHDVALAFGADEFERQEGAEGLLGGNHAANRGDRPG